MLSQLPAISFVPFNAFRAARPLAAWCAPGIDAAMLIERHAWFLPLAGDCASAATSEAAVFYAERYGGAGLNFNGGGARCGLIDGVQIKGIGRNPLAGSGSSFWHSYGGESVANGVREAIWSEVAGRCLPFGSVKILGLIDTGTEVPLFSTDGAPRTTRRGLTIREAALRPGHFARARFYGRVDEVREGLPRDALRTAEAMQVLPGLLAAALGAGPGSPFADNTRAMLARFAIQLAAAQAKRIIHGTLNASNICLDGRWIDYGTITTISDYGRIIVGAALPDIWGFSRISRVITDFVLYANKYLAPQHLGGLGSAAGLYEYFMQTFELRLEHEFLKLTGVPESVIADAPAPVRSSLYSCMREIIGRGNKEPFKLFHPCSQRAPAMPDKMGQFHLNTILQQAARCTCAAEADRALAGELGDAALRARFVAAYWPLREYYLARPAGAQASHFFMALNAYRVNRSVPALYRHVLDERIERHVLASEDSAPFIAATVASACTVLGEPQHGAMTLDAWAHGMPVAVWQDGTVLIDGKPATVPQCLATLDVSEVPAATKASLEALCAKRPG